MVVGVVVGVVGGGTRLPHLFRYLVCSWTETNKKCKKKLGKKEKKLGNDSAGGANSPFCFPMILISYFFLFRFTSVEGGLYYYFFWSLPKSEKEKKR